MTQGLNHQRGGPIGRRRFAPARSFVEVPSDPDHGSDPNDSVAGSIGRLVNAFMKRFDMDITAAYDPTGGHVSAGHNVTGTATDVVPADGNWDGAFAIGLRLLTSLGFEVLYDGQYGTIAYPNHGEGNHAHIEWVGNGTTADARQRLRGYMADHGGGTDYGGGPIGFAKEFVLGDPLEALNIGSGDGLKKDLTGFFGGAASSVGGEVVSYLGQLLGEKAATILLNIALVAGGAFLFYFGIARALGIGEPVGTPLRAARGLSAAGAMAAA